MSRHPSPGALRRPAAALLVAALMGTTAACGSAAAHGSAAPIPVNRFCSGTIAVMAPTGSTGRSPSQLNWARVALDTFNAVHGTEFTVEASNVDDQADLAAAEAARLAADPQVVGVVGPITSRATQAAGPVLDRAGLSYVSPSATAVSLTDGHLRNFYRVVASDAVQGPTLARFVSDSLHARNVVVLDDQEVYSTNLATSVIDGLQARGVTARRLLVTVHQPDFSGVVSQLATDTGAVVMPLVQPADAQQFATQLAAAEAGRHGLHPALVGGDALFSLSDYDVSGTYVSTFERDVATLPQGSAEMKLYNAIYGDLGSFGAPAASAMEAVATAALDSCSDGMATRRGVTAALPTVHPMGAITGTRLAFAPDHEVVGGRYYVYRIDGSRYQLVSS